MKQSHHKHRGDEVGRGGKWGEARLGPNLKVVLGKGKLSQGAPERPQNKKNL